ncbi:MAG: hydrolase [Gammaproteobacteria bacterium]|nr:hydrolase [Gammaproteobacteria bacterium]MDG1509305.1 hydrolase [Flavobacteriaceae bacterium]MDG2275047.1 hydrolase [Flavobacteriaceae bacterium]|tara:strand:+ start:827 stop:1228 length:402 start_codon:yes stop_codon:yes gene_type:complete
MLPNKNLIIAIDFDGTIVEDAYPKIGKPMIFAFETMKKLQSEGYRLILWTYRSDRKLQEAVDFCKQQGLEFYAINKSYPEEEFDGKISRKINATFFVDDRNIGGFIGWTAVHKLLLNYEPEIKKKKGFFSFLK